MNFKAILPEVLGTLLALALLNLWYVSSLVIEHRVIPSTYDYFLKAIVVLFAAFFGSFSAFYLNTRKENHKEIQDNISSLNSALFVTIRQINSIMVLNKAIEPLEKDPLRFLNLPAMYASDNSDLKIELNRLEFLLKDHPNLLLDLSVEQGRFESAIKITNMRAEFHHNDLQKALNDAGFNVANPTLPQLVQAVGPRVTGTTIKLTDGMYEQLNLCVESLLEVHEKLYDIARGLFPNEPFVKFQPDA